MSVNRKIKRRKKPLKRKKIELDMTKLDGMLERAEKGKLQESDIELIKAMAECIDFMSQTVDKKATTIKRLLGMIFGAKTEKKNNVQDKQEEQSEDSEPETGKAGSDKKKNKKMNRNGCNGADSYTGAKQVEVPHPDLNVGDICLKCTEGKLYTITDPGVVIRVKGSAPLQAAVYKLEKLRCSLCGKIFTAPLPKGAGNKKYDASAVAMIALLKYGSGLPFNRLMNLQKNLGVPLPSSTQWDIVNKSFPNLKPAYEHMIELAAQGKVLHNDDTNMKIQSLIKDNIENSPARKGMFTTGIVSICEDNRKIILFFTGRNHAGENLGEVLAQRDETLQSPLQMCDASSRNTSSEFATILAYCLIHARRNFFNVITNFPEECQFVIDTLAEVYHFDAEAKEQNMSAELRLLHHQEKSAPLMKKLEIWLDEQIEQKKVEPNSGLGDAIFYMQDHWQELTTFLRIPNAPLDNNICERALKKAILHRKNSLFYKTEHGATVGDMYMSLIHTCELAGVNPFDYLKALETHSDHVQISPADWMPWNYPAAQEGLPEVSQ